VLQKFVGGARAVDADQDLRAGAVGDLPKRVREHGEVVGDRVRAGVARP
jgi:hypothetical protein